MSESQITTARGSHLSRISTIAIHTFTQLVRMKVFYFMAIFAVILIASNFFDLPQHSGPEAAGEHAIRMIKNWSTGPMTLFSVVLGVVATALLLPKDIEDRTLYTILAKPVPRFDYLAGKLLGVVLLLFVSLAIMDLLMVALLQFRVDMLIDQQTEVAKAMGWSAQEISALREETLANGVNASLHAAVFAIFLKATIMAALALLISTFSTSTLFTAVVGFLLFFIGHFQADAREIYMQSGQLGEGGIAKYGSLAFAMLVPDLQLFNVVDSITEGKVMPLMLMGKLTLVALYYLIFYTVASWFVFSDKEF